MDRLLNSDATFSWYDGIAFLIYYLLIVGLGIYLSRRKKEDSRDYFLAGKKLPWYVIGASIISANISTEHFIGMVGWAYIYGVAVASWEWGNWFTFTVLIWIFLPFYLRGGLYTMPEFLERRFNRACRYLFAGVTSIQYVLAMMAAVLYAGGMALNGMFGFDVVVGICLLAAAAGVYTVWGGLFSAVWIEFVQFLVLMGAGILVSVLALMKAGGLTELMARAPEKFVVFYPATHEMIPWTGLITGFLAIGIWYNCTNQFIVQRCLGARSEWDGRMGVIFAGYAKIILPVILVIPGIVAYEFFGSQIGNEGDLAYPFLVRQLLGPGLVGVVMAGLAAAIMSTVSSALNSTSTIVTIDLYQPIVNQSASEEKLIWMGRLIGGLALTGATLIAIWYSYSPGLTVFGLIQDIGAWVAAPVSAIFILGILWKGVKGPAATLVLIFGFPFTWFVDYVLFTGVGWLEPYGSFLHRTFIVWCVCLFLLWILSRYDRHRRILRIGFGIFYGLLLALSLIGVVQSIDPILALVLTLGIGLPLGYLCDLALRKASSRPPNEVEEIVWKPSQMNLMPEEVEQNRGFRNLTFWWAGFVGSIFLIYIVLGVFQFTTG